jgi:C-terminal processing protease CtpA/Prc
MTHQQAMADHIEALDSDRVKALVLDWLSKTGGSLSDFERLLESEPQNADVAALEYGQLDETLTFQPMTDAEMVESSLHVLEEYKRTGNGVSHERFSEWLDGLQTDQPHS